MDKQTFIQRLDEHSRLLYHVAWTMLRAQEDVRDALQETALRAWEKRGSLKSEDRFRAWVTRICVNVCNDMLRRRRRQAPLEETAEPSIPPPDLSLSLALQALPEKQRLPLVMRYVEGMSEQEIAAILRLPASTVRGRIFRAKQQLRKELAE